MKHPTPGSIFNIVDDDPAPRSQVRSHQETLPFPLELYLSHPITR